MIKRIVLIFLILYSCTSYDNSQDASTVSELKRCNTSGNECENGFSCINVYGENVCTIKCSKDEECSIMTNSYCDQNTGICLLKLGSVGDPCEKDENCNPSLSCFSWDKAGYCSKKCAYEDPCHYENTLCIKMSGNVGNYCLPRCSSNSDCSEGLSCTKLIKGEIYVCFP